jgi:Rieske Fe-S protein
MRGSRTSAGDSRKITRREFEGSFLMAITAAGSAVLAGCGKSYPERMVAKTGDIPVGGFKVFTYPEDDRPCILLHPDDATYRAFSRLCTHNACPVHYRPGVERLECPCHQGAFSAIDGSVVYGPPPKPLPQVVLERRGDELVAMGMKTPAVG